MSNLYRILTFLAISGSIIFCVGQQGQRKNATLFISNLASTGELASIIVEVEPDSIASGIFMPIGPPNNPPIRVEAGKVCIVDLVQTYLITGTLSGSFVIDFRILVDGPCGEPPGTYSEKWIAHGTFYGKLNEIPASGKFRYLATSKLDGEVDGQMVFDQGINGELDVKGNLNDRKLTYKGWLNE